MSEPLSFTLDREEIPVTLQKKDGSPLELVLRELDAAGRESYLQNITNRMSSDKQGGSMIKDVGGLQSALLTKCLFYVGTNKAVEVKEIQTWRAKTVQALFEKAQEMAGLNETAEQDAKND